MTVSFKARGRRVKHKEFDLVGRIGYYDPASRLVWVVWPPKPFNEDNKTWSSGGYPAEDLLTYAHDVPALADLTASTPRCTITSNESPPHRGPAQRVERSSVMARKRTEEVEEFDDLEEEDEEFEEFDEDLDEVEAEEEAAATKAKAKSKGTSTKKEKPKGIGATAIAEKLGVEPKAFRAWLRNTVAKGEVDWAADLAARESKERYNFGEKWNSELVTGIMKSHKEWSERPREPRGFAKKGEGGAKKASTKAPAKKAPAKKASSSRAKKA